MEDFPKISGTTRLPLTLPVPDYLRDHVFNGRAVFPAVEAMQALAESARAAIPGLDVRVITGADFTKFLYLDPDASSLEAFNELETHGDGRIISKLITVRKQGKTSITRAVEHVTLSFPGTYDMPAEPPLDVTLGLEGICLHPDKGRIYGDLVPFRPAYQNIESLLVSENGAMAMVSGGTPEAPAEPLGSPFPLDASFHAACVWGQRYAGIVGFPVHIDTRIIRKKTKPGETYIARIAPVPADPGLLIFNVWIYDTGGDLCEEVHGLHMRDVSGNTLLPPQWILCGAEKPLEIISARCRDMVVLELGTITEPCEKILSSPEQKRFGTMREKRRLSFLSARLALKKLSRRLSGNDMSTPSSAITTMDPDGRPLCPLTNGAETIHCTASHDSRFAVAAAAENPIGIDVEEITPRVLKGQSHYMHDEEIVLVRGHPLGEMEASVRVWSAKEAVSKATGMHLVETWRRAAVKEIGMEKSIVQVDDKLYEAAHAFVDGHIFTLISL